MLWKEASGMQPSEVLTGVEPESSEHAQRRRDIVDRLGKEARQAPGGPYREVLERMRDFIESTAPQADFRPAIIAKLAAAMKALLDTVKQPFQVPVVLIDANKFLGDHAAGMAARAAQAGMNVPQGVGEKIAAATSVMESIASGVVDMMTAAQRSDTPALLGSAYAPPTKPEEEKTRVPEDLKNWVNPAIGRIGIE